MPFGLLVWRLAPVLPCLGRGKRDIRNCDAIGRIARFRVASEVTEQNYLIDGCHSVLSVCGGLLDHEKLLHALDRHALFDNFDRPATQIAHADAVTRADLRAAYFILKCAAPDAFDNSVAVDVHEVVIEGRSGAELAAFKSESHDGAGAHLFDAPRHCACGAWQVRRRVSRHAAR